MINLAMSISYTINIQDEIVAALKVKEKSGVYTVLEEQIFEKDELKEYLVKKKRVYLSADQDEILDEKVVITNSIKNDKVLRNTILHKLSNVISSKNIMFNYYEISRDAHDETITYQVDGVYEKEYFKLFEYPDELEDVKSATTSRYALFSLSQKCIDSDSYLVVYSRGSKIVLLAVSKNKLIFSRASTVIVDKPEDRQSTIVDEISRTIAYTNQQFRDINFSAIAISGSLAIDDEVCEHIYMAFQTPITVLYPNTFVKGLSAEEHQSYILAIGNLFVGKDFQFIPDFVKSAQTFSLSKNILLVLSSLVLFIIMFFTLEAYENYSNMLDRFSSIESRLTRMVRKSEMHSKEELEKNFVQLQIAEKYLQYRPSDMLLTLKPLIELEKPVSLEWSTKNENLYVKLEFKKAFTTLETLHEFEHSFLAALEEINSTYQLKYTNKTNYAKMSFEYIVSSAKKKKAPPQRRRRRR